MSLKTYDRHGLEHEILASWQFKHYYLENDDPNCRGPFAPGDWIRHDTDGGKGMVVAIDDSQATILWSIEPRDGFQMPPVRRVNVNLVMNELVKVQPMTLPAGLVFYLDYIYGSNYEMDKKCNEGPLYAKMYWKSRRLIKCYKERIQSLLSSLRSWSRSLSGKKLTTGSKTAGVDSETSRRLMEKWTKTGLRRPHSGRADDT